MTSKLSIVVALAAGFTGSAILRYVAPPVALAQSPAPVTQEIRAQSFTLVDQSNNVIGVFTSEPVQGAFRHVPGSSALQPQARVVLRNPNGRTIWSPDADMKVLPLTLR